MKVICDQISLISLIALISKQNKENGIAILL